MRQLFFMTNINIIYAKSSNVFVLIIFTILLQQLVIYIFSTYTTNRKTSILLQLTIIMMINVKINKYIFKN